MTRWTQVLARLCKPNGYVEPPTSYKMRDPRHSALMLLTASASLGATPLLMSAVPTSQPVAAKLETATISSKSAALNKPVYVKYILDTTPPMGMTVSLYSSASIFPYLTVYLYATKKDNCPLKGAAAVTFTDASGSDIATLWRLKYNDCDQATFPLGWDAYLRIIRSSSVGMEFSTFAVNLGAAEMKPLHDLRTAAVFPK